MQNISRKNIFIGLIGIFCLALGCYLFNPFHYYFLNDDLVHIPLSKEGVLFQRRSFRPIADLSVQLDYFLWGKKAWGYHVSNLLLHVANSIAVFILSKHIYRKYVPQPHKTSISILTGLLFFVYAFHSESVFWILGRSGSLGSLFFIGAVLLYGYRHNGMQYFICSMLLFELGLLSYESVWIFPLIAILISGIDIKREKRRLKTELIYPVITWVLFALHLLIRYKVIGQLAGAYEAEGFLQFDIIKLIANFFRLFMRTFLPPVQQVSALIIVCMLVVAAAIILGFRRNWKKAFQQHFSLALLGLICISLLPYLSLGISTHTTEGERYLYLPTVFACMLMIHVISTSASETLQVILYALLFIYHGWFLASSATHYQTASAISKITFQQINLLNGKKRLFVDSLPESYKGALIFRLGFDEGVNWLRESGTVDSVVVLSLKAENTRWSNPYTVKTHGALTQYVIRQQLIKDTSMVGTYVPLPVPPYTFDPKADALFVFKNDHLEVIK